MKKDELMSLFVYLVMIAFAVIVGSISITPAITEGYIPDGTNAFLFLLVTLFIGVIVNAILFEIAHVLGAIIGGYQVISCNILSFCFFKEKNESGKLKTKFRVFRSFDGLAGETIITPKKEKPYPLLYVFGPLVLFLVEVVACTLVFSYIPDVNFDLDPGLMLVKYGLLVNVYVGAMITIYNYWPHRLDSLTDGYRLILLNKKINIDAYNETLKIASDRMLGIPHGEIKTFDQITDFTAQVNLMCAIDLGRENKEKAQEIIEHLLENKDKMSKETLRTVKTFKCLAMFLDDEIEEAYSYYQNEFTDYEKKFTTSCMTLDATRLYLLIVGLKEKSQSEVERALDRAKKLIKRLIPSEVEGEEKLLQMVKDKVNLI